MEGDIIPWLYDIIFYYIFICAVITFIVLSCKIYILAATPLEASSCTLIVLFFYFVSMLRLSILNIKKFCVFVSFKSLEY